MIQIQRINCAECNTFLAGTFVPGPTVPCYCAHCLDHLNELLIPIVRDLAPSLFMFALANAKGYVAANFRLDFEHSLVYTEEDKK